MAASLLYKTKFKYEDVTVNLLLQAHHVQKVQTDPKYVENLFEELIEQGKGEEMGLPAAPDASKAKFVSIDVVPVNPDEATGNIFEDDIVTDDTGLLKRRKDASNWTDSMTMLLIRLRLDKEEDFEKPISKRRHWAEISEKMKENGYNVSGDDCDTKWRNLMGTYRKNKERATKYGEGVIMWKFYGIMNEGLANKANAVLQPETILSSITSPLTFPTSPPEIQTTQPSHSQTSALIFSQTRKRKRFRRAADEPPAWFANYVQQKEELDRLREERDHQRWKQHSDLEERKVAAMFALIEVLKKK